jgi:hypothetical protein
MLKVDTELKETEVELRSVQQQIETEESKAAAAAGELQGLVAPCPDTIVLWQQEAAEPLKKELSNSLAELEELQRLYMQGWDEREKDWSARCSRSEQAYQERGLKVEMRLRQEASSLQLQLEEQAERAQEGTQAAEQRLANLREELRCRMDETADERNACLLLQNECNIATEDEQHARSMLAEAEAHHAEIEQSRKRDRERCEQLELQARRQRERELAELRRVEAAEASRMRSFLQQTLSTISAAATSDGSPAKSRTGDLGADAASRRDR